MKSKLMILSAMIGIVACKPRSFNQGAESSDTDVLSLPNPPGLERGSGFAYGTESDPEYRRHLENKAKAAARPAKPKKKAD